MTSIYVPDNWITDTYRSLTDPSHVGHPERSIRTVDRFSAFSHIEAVSGGTLFHLHPGMTIHLHRDGQLHEPPRTDVAVEAVRLIAGNSYLIQDRFSTPLVEFYVRGLGSEKAVQPHRQAADLTIFPEREVEANVGMAEALFRVRSEVFHLISNNARDLAGNHPLSEHIRKVNEETFAITPEIFPLVSFVSDEEFALLTQGGSDQDFLEGGLFHADADSLTPQEKWELKRAAGAIKTYQGLHEPEAEWISYARLLEVKGPHLVMPGFFPSRNIPDVMKSLHSGDVLRAVSGPLVASYDAVSASIQSRTATKAAPTATL